MLPRSRTDLTEADVRSRAEADGIELAPADLTSIFEGALALHLSAELVRAYLRNSSSEDER